METAGTFVCSGFWDKKDDYINQFLKRARIEQCPQGYILVRQGDSCKKVYLLLDGCLSNSTIAENGEKKCNLVFTGPVVVGLAALSGEESQVELRCLTKVRVASVESGQLAGWPPEMLLPIVLCQTYKNQIVYRQLRELSFLSSELQMIRLLSDLRSAQLPSEYQAALMRPDFVAEVLGISRGQLGVLAARLDEKGELNEQERQMLCGGKKKK